MRYQNLRFETLLRVLLGTALIYASLLPSGLARAGGSGNALPENASPKQVLERALENFNADRRERIVLVNHRGGKRFEREIKIWLKREDDGHRVLGTFTKPEDIRGTSFLVLPGSDDTEQVSSNQYFVYMPELRRLRRVSGAQRADSFFGTYLSQGDMEPHPASHYAARSVRASSVDGEPVFELEAAPRFDAGYDRVVLTVARADAAILKITEFRDERTEPLREIATKRAWLETVNGRVLPTRLTVSDGRGRGTTELTFLDREVTSDTPSTFFSTSHLLRVGR